MVPYDITNYQQLYFYTESFEEANEKLRAFAESMPRPFVLVYNPNTQVAFNLKGCSKQKGVPRAIKIAASMPPLSSKT